MVYALLREELDRQGGIHALQMRTKTPEEDRKQQSREQG
jgi:BolA-like protein 1